MCGIFAIGSLDYGDLSLGAAIVYLVHFLERAHAEPALLLVDELCAKLQQTCNIRVLTATRVDNKLEHFQKVRFVDVAVQLTPQRFSD